MLVWLCAGAWGASPGEGTRPAAAKGVTLSGKVSAGGKLLLTDDDTAWSVSNAEVLKGFENLYVTIKCRMDPRRGVILVLSVLEPRASHDRHLGDAAFRR